jgi:predicted TIM-barrel fold metal-dependent hydrolase
MGDRLIVVSADGHAAAPIETYRPYLETRYHGDLDTLLAEENEYRDRIAGPAHPVPEAMQTFDDRGAMAGGGEAGSYDLDVRLKEMDAEGCAAEIVHHGTQAAPPVFFGSSNKAYPPEVRWAGTKAYHRWMADFMAPAGGRLVGVGEPGPCLDMDATVQELDWLAQNGFASVTLPGAVADPELPPLFDRYYDPFWEACEAHGLVLSVHAGWGQPQGMIYRFFDIIHRKMAEVGGGELDQMEIQKALQEELNLSPDSPLRLDLGPQAVLWKLMLGGAFDRFPNLKLALTEIRADWLPPTLAALDQAAADTPSNLTMKPSEYFARNCVIAPSSIHLAEVEMRHDIGVDRLLFGMDFPHHEGTWPNTKEWIQVSMAGVPHDEARKILGENAVRFYGLDRAALQQVADRIGPSASEVLLSQHAVEQRLVDHFDKRSGFARPAEPVNASRIDQAYRADAANLTSV